MSQGDLDQLREVVWHGKRRDFLEIALKAAWLDKDQHFPSRLAAISKRVHRAATAIKRVAGMRLDPFPVKQDFVFTLYDKERLIFVLVPVRRRTPAGGEVWSIVAEFPPVISWVTHIST